MIQKFGNNVFKRNGVFGNIGDPMVLSDVLSSFPQTPNANTLSQITLTFSTATSITVNYGNGVIQTYSTTTINGTYQINFYDKGANYIPTPPAGAIKYTYPDGLNIKRTITISLNKNLLTLISLANFPKTPQDFLLEFAAFPSLNSFTINSSLNIINLNLANASLTNIGINNAFYKTSPYYAKIPNEVFSMPLQSLAFGTPGMTGLDWNTTNFNRIGSELASTLIKLSIVGQWLDDTNNGQGALPSNLINLTNLTTFIAQGTNYTVVPGLLNSITGLTLLNFANSNALADYGNFSNLTNLTSLTFTGCTVLPTIFPSWFANLTLLKIFNYQGSFRTQTRIASFISSVYNLVTTNAVMTGLGQFRYITVNCGEATTGDGTQIPSGIYQQPIGYVQGSSNGSPASSLEMIWVMVHQYGHVWTYRTV